MGKLVQFENREKGGTVARESDGTAQGQILIFTGVRYERQTEVTPTKPTATSSGGKRKRG